MWVAIQTCLLWVRVCWEWIFLPPQLHLGWLGECVKMGDFEGTNGGDIFFSWVISVMRCEGIRGKK
jgi:hypothetical protein